MQAHSTIQRFDLGQFKVTALALGLAASVAAGALTWSQTRDAAPETGVSRPAATTSYQRMRFIEVNTQLPVAAPAQRTDYRFIDMNTLPEAAAQATPDYRLLEINTLPGDDAQLLPPFGQTGTSY
jgi:hypothetical protein